MGYFRSVGLDVAKTSEHGHSHGHSHGPVALPTDDQERIDEGREDDDDMSVLYQHPAQTRAQVIETAHEFGYGRHDEQPMSPPKGGHIRTGSQTRRNLNRPYSKRNSSSSAIPPAPGSSETRAPHSLEESGNRSLLKTGKNDKRVPSPLARDANEAEEGHSHDDGHDHSHGANGHDHGKSNGGGHSHGGGGHSHGSMNMRGVFLHVVGDALGNVGVIAAGLVIWFVHERWALYFDPGISLIITCIILSSAWPLVKSASYILMQGVPSHVSLDSVRDSIRDVPGVVSVHELHVWQLSETTVVASVHTLIEPGADYMEVAGGIREAMHSHGIHSVTIQPEFYSEEVAAQLDGEVACLIRCPPEVCGTDTCCPPTPKDSASAVEDEHAGHNHEGHSH